MLPLFFTLFGVALALFIACVFYEYASKDITVSYKGHKLGGE